jgi:hypothetical protein
MHVVLILRVDVSRQATSRAIYMLADIHTFRKQLISSHQTTLVRSSTSKTFQGSSMHMRIPFPVDIGQYIYYDRILTSAIFGRPMC